MALKHGVYVSEIATSIVPPITSEGSLPVIFGTAPINQTNLTNVNKPVLCYTYADAVSAFGVSDNYDKFTLCEAIYSQFALFASAPVVLVNVLNQTSHSTNVTNEARTLVGDKATLINEGVITSTVVVKNSGNTVTYTKDTDYALSFDTSGYMVVTRITTGTMTAGQAISVSYSYLDPSKVTSADIIGGVNVTTGVKTGLELINDIFPRFGLVPAQILAPNWSQTPAVAAVMVAKAQSINTMFKAIALTDVDTTTVTKYQDVSAWKNTNNYTSQFQVVCWPKVKLDTKQFHLSTQLSGLMCKTDGENDGIPYVTPSNKSLRANSAVIKSGTEVWLGPENGAYLNGQGIVTALNFIGGWKAWGNQTGAYPAVSDPKDQFLPIRRMFNWIANSLILTYWQKIDYPVNKRLIRSIVDSANIWLNGLTSRGFILGGRVEFLEAENPITDLMNGTIRFHIYVTPPTPAQEIDFVQEYDPQYLKTLFA